MLLFRHFLETRLASIKIAQLFTYGGPGGCDAWREYRLFRFYSGLVRFFLDDFQTELLGPTWIGPFGPVSKVGLFRLIIGVVVLP